MISMSRIGLALVVAAFALAGCTNGPLDYVAPPNGSSNAECQHASGQDTGYVVNCARHNDDRNQRDILR
jgi:hypothetical protein